MGYASNRNMGSGGSLDEYLRILETDESGLLTVEEEKQLAHAVARGDAEARNRLVRCNARLVVRIASQYAGRGLSLEDLVGEGNLGLIRAAEEFDPAYGTRFSTYSAYWIKQSIRLALTNTSAMIRLPSHMVTLLRKWAKARRLLERELGREAHFEEIADRMELNESQRNYVRNAFQAKYLCVEAGRADEESSWQIDEFVLDAPSVETRMEEEERYLWLMRRMTRLTDLERAVITLRYGLHGAESLTWCEIGSRLGVTREWARKLELKALEKLRKEHCEPKPKVRVAKSTDLRKHEAASARRPAGAGIPQTSIVPAMLAV
ncbi:sigma-70 family RNA polymerase sigma factor [bacterium]|nr:sigma-70 family RNA polymerase sigma factor [bacterium]